MSIDRRTVHVILLIICSLCFAAYSASGYLASDDRDYFTSVQVLAGEQDLIPKNVRAARLGVSVPGWIAYSLLGSDIQLTAYAMAVYLPILSFVIYYLGRIVHSHRTGLLAGFLVISSPIVLTLSGTLTPDIPLAIWVGLSAVVASRLLIAGADTRKKFSKEIGFPFLLGLTIALGYTAKEPALLLLAPIGLALFALQKPFSWSCIIKQGISIFVPVIIIIVGEYFLLAHLSGDYGYMRLRGTQGLGETEILHWRILSQGGYNPFARLEVAWGRLYPVTGLMLPLAILALLVYLFVPRGKHSGQSKAQVLVWVMGCWLGLYLVIGSTNLFDYRPPPIKVHYFIPAAAIVSVPIAHVLLVLFTMARGQFAKFHVNKTVVAALGIFALLAMTVDRLNRFSMHTGNHPRSGVVRSFIEAYADLAAIPATERESLPLYLGPHIAHRMWPMLISWRHAGNPPGEIHRFDISDQGELQSMPKPPFLMLTSNRTPGSMNKHLGDLRRNTRLSQQIQRLAESDERVAELYLKGVYIAPAGRLDQLRTYLTPLLGSVPVAVKTVSDSYGVTLKLVKPAAER